MKVKFIMFLFFLKLFPYFQVPPDSVERAAGLLFFDKIDRKQLTKINGQKTGWF